MSYEPWHSNRPRRCCKGVPIRSIQFLRSIFSRIVLRHGFHHDLCLCLLIFGISLNTRAWSAGTESPEPWTLQDLVRFTIEHSPNLTKARQEKQQAHLEEQQAQAHYWPRMRLESIHGWRNQEPGAYTTNESSWTGLTLSQNLWHNGIDAKTLEIARLNKRKAELLYFQKRDELGLTVVQEYYRYSQLVKSLEIQKNQQKLLKRQFDLVSDEYLHGLRSRRDFLRFKSQAQRAELDLQKQLTLVEKSRLTLMALGGMTSMEEQRQFVPEDTPPPLLDLFKNPAEIQSTYEYQLFELTAMSTDLTQELGLKKLGTDLNLDLKAGFNSSDYWNTNRSFSAQGVQSWSAFLTFNWTLWDGGETTAKRAIIDLTREMQKTDLLQKEILLRSEIQKLQKQFLQLKENFKTSEELLVLEQNNFLFLEGEYRQSKATYLDFINGVRDLSEAQNRHWGNLFELKQGMVLYHYYKGSLLRYVLKESADNDDSTAEETL